jgi:cytochrome c551/c552
MASDERSLKFLVILFSAGAAGLLAGCSFVPSHQVAVDAISGPVTSVGQSYRLSDKDPMATRESGQHKLIFACVAAALDANGVFEAPVGTKPDFTVEVDYGANRNGGVPRTSGMPPTTENFLQLSARRVKSDGSPGKGEEIWNVRASLLEERVDLNTLIPVLAAVAADYAGLDTQVEKMVKVREDQGNIAHVKTVARAVTLGRSAP